MDYEKKYKEALERAKQFSEKPYLEDSAGIVEYIFPELKEPELAELKDERIMKALIHFFSNDENTSFEYWEGIPKAEVLAWLKKQGQVKESLIFQHENKTCKENNDSLTCEDERIKNEIIAFVEQSIHRGGGTPIPQEQENKWLAWLEKQGEQKHTCLLDNSESNVKFPFKAKVKSNGKIVTIQGGQLSMDCKKYGKYQSNVEDGYMVYEPEDLELVCNIEQKSNDKVEPKFHEGDWVFAEEIKGYKQGPFQIKSLSKYGYCFDEDRVMPFSTDDLMSLWTIKDAKDGDVLHCWIDGDEFVLIYKGIRDGYITTYGHLYQKLKSFSEEPTSMFCRTIQGHFTPATKEQRDLLFQKMHESGYEWDAEKKELKKIEQKSNWSEEDERNLQGLIDEIEANKNSAPEYDLATYDRFLSWLKSLKERVQPSHWKPTKVQLELLKEACDKRWEPDGLDPLYTLWEHLKNL